ncbi:MAG: AI-2E family transporter [Myxococcota bacterium]
MSAPRQKGDVVHVPRWLHVAGAYGWRFVAAAAAFYVFLHVMKELRVVVIPIVLGVVLATLLEPVARWMSNHKVPRPVSAVLTILIGIGLLAGLLALFGHGVAGEMGELGRSLEKGYRQAIGWVVTSPLNVTRDQVTSWVDEQMSGLQAQAVESSTEIMTSLAQVIQLVIMLLLTIVFALYFTWDGDRQFDRTVSLLPERMQGHAREMGARTWRTVSGYMRAIFLIAAIDALLFGLGIWIIGVPLVLPLMLLMFVGSIIPIVGPIVATLVAALVALADGGLAPAGLTILVGTAVQQTEGNVLHPFLMGRVVHLHPAVVLFAVTAGATLAGVVGVFIAIPLVGALKAILSYAREQAAL